VLSPLACVVAATFLHFASLYYLLPTLPLYVQHLGGSTYEVGLIVGIFALASLLARPFIGVWMDRAGRRGFLLVGAGIYVLASLGYWAIRSVPGLLLWRVFHAIGLATFSTAAASLAGDLAPPRRRGAAMGVFGLAQAAALAVGPGVGRVSLTTFGYGGLFLATACTALAALVSALALPGDPFPVRKRALRDLAGRAFLDAAAVPAAVQFAASVAYGTIVSFIALVAVERGLDVVGSFFALLAMSSLSIRLVAGRAYDAWGAAPVLAPALLVLAGGVTLLAVAGGAALFLLAAVLAGLGIGATQTTLMAHVVDRSGPDGRASSVAAFMACWELGVAGGAILMGRLAEAYGFYVMFMGTTSLPLLGLGSLHWLAGRKLSRL
jgi:MFS family permease